MGYMHSIVYGYELALLKPDARLTLAALPQVIGVREDKDELLVTVSIEAVCSKNWIDWWVEALAKDEDDMHYLIVDWNLEFEQLLNEAREAAKGQSNG